MDTAILRKKLQTFKSGKGQLRNISPELIIEVLRAWEAWAGPSSQLYRELGVSKMQMTALLKNGKKLIKERVDVASDFKEIFLESESALNPQSSSPVTSSKCGLEIIWGEGTILKFTHVDQMVDFLKKVA
jgi:hypothetical protein